MDKKEKLLGELLLELNIIGQEKLDEALAEQHKTGEMLGEVLLKKKMIDKKVLGGILEYKLDIPYVNLVEYDIDKEIVGLFPRDFIKQHNSIPVKKEDNMLFVAMAAPMDSGIIEKLRLKSGMEIVPLLTTPADIDEALAYYFGSQTEAHSVLKEITDSMQAIEELAETAVDDVSGAPVVKLVNSLIKESVDLNASDLHLEATKGDMRVRYRIDGMLYDKMTIPKNVQNSVVSRIKVMADLNIAERRNTQDGRISLPKIHGDKDIDIRVATFPTIFGESVVLRILDKSRMTLELEQLGLMEDERKLFTTLLSKTYGMVLVTGPTGSGKTTTLYGVLNKINDPKKKIITIEDPVEYQLNGVNQIQVNAATNMTFENGLRSILRLDPDTIMVGEIRDAETAKIAIESALTGHLVLSTLHTNDAPSTAVRLVDMGVEPFLISSALIGVVAQRLVRIICPDCKDKYTPSKEEVKSVGLEEGKEYTFYKGTGCKLCNYSGYKGRTAVFEIMKISELLRRLIMSHEPSPAIKNIAVREGMRTMWDSGVLKILNGTTTPEELFRVLYTED